MKQRTSARPWSASPARDAKTRVRLLVESRDPALELSDFSRFEECGIDVVLCAGPDHSPTECPLLRDEPCPLAGLADVVLFDPKRRSPFAESVLSALAAHHPSTPVLVPVDGGEVAAYDEFENVVALRVPCSIEAQLRAVWRAARRAPAPDA